MKQLLALAIEVAHAGVCMDARLRHQEMYGVFGITMALEYFLRDFEGGVTNRLFKQWPRRPERMQTPTRPAASISCA